MEVVKKGILVLLLTLLSSGIHAGVITYNGYSHDTSTELVTGNGLEWMRWDLTNDITVEQFLDGYGGLVDDGWVLATNVQVASLLNAFFPYQWDTDENTQQFSYVRGGEQFSIDDPSSIFIQMFGDTYATGGHDYNYGDPLEQSTAIFGADLDGDGKFNLVSVRDEWTESDSSTGSASVQLTHDAININSTLFQSGGLSLVRAVPEPSSIAILLLVFSLLIVVRKS